jgi:hypothetical protein
MMPDFSEINSLAPFFEQEKPVENLILVVRGRVLI